MAYAAPADRLSPSVYSAVHPSIAKDPARSEYAHLIAFAEQQSALFERFRRAGSAPPIPAEWPGEAAYLRELRSAAEEAERLEAERAFLAAISRKSLRQRIVEFLRFW